MHVHIDGWGWILLFAMQPAVTNPISIANLSNFKVLFFQWSVHVLRAGFPFNFGVALNIIEFLSCSEGHRII